MGGPQAGGTVDCCGPWMAVRIQGISVAFGNSFLKSEPHPGCTMAEQWGRLMAVLAVERVAQRSSCDQGYPELPSHL